MMQLLDLTIQTAHTASTLLNPCYYWPDSKLPILANTTAVRIYTKQAVAKLQISGATPDPLITGVYKDSVCEMLLYKGLR